MAAAEAAKVCPGGSVGGQRANEHYSGNEEADEDIRADIKSLEREAKEIDGLAKLYSANPGWGSAREGVRVRLEKARAILRKQK